MVKEIDLSNHKVLVAEDEEANYMVLSALLGKFKPTLTWVKNGQEAVKKVDEQEFDLVFMDIKMPIMNGVEALTEIKKSHPKLPVVAQTAFARPEEIEDYLNMGFDGYLTKPIRVNDLIATIRQFM